MGKLFGSWVITAVIFVFCFSAGTAWADGPKKMIGVLVWNEAVRYADALRGIVDQLAAEGFTETDIKMEIRNANSSKAAAARLAHELAILPMDMYVGIGTSAALALTKEIKTAPVIFAMVYDPVDSGIVTHLQSSENNTTGVSIYFSAEKFLGVLSLQPNIKRLAVVYTPGEKNSEGQLRRFLQFGGNFNIDIVPVPLAGKAETKDTLECLKGRVDAVYLSGGSVVDRDFDRILAINNNSRLITVSHLLDYSDRGVFLTVGPQAYALGLMSGKKAALVLKGTRPRDIPISDPEKMEVVVNMRVAESLGVRVSGELLKEATRIIK
ncbi:MAG: ABC transporter substrate-binding protein [Candidatus Omnitrophica bacterium]|nr:ABC transporter substrate-binding protein [Candidatus Omnitrophota bacterium]